MVHKIYEGVELIHIDPYSKLTLTQIQKALHKAYTHKMYAKFYTDKYFIQVNFMKDNTISVASNIRLPQFTVDLYRKSKMGWTIPLVKQFIYQWMQISRRSLK